ncbi:MAG: tetratricopeptide repeat protein [Chthoniobacterales bacterium]
MWGIVRQQRAIGAAILIVAFALPARSEDAPDLAAAYGAAMAEFQAGNFAKAATELEALVARVEVSPQVEPIFYTIGCAYFNAEDYPKAITAFRNYQRKFPKGAHAAGVAFAIAQSNLRSKNFKDAAAQMAALENDPQLREQALLFEAEAFKAQNKNDEAIRALDDTIKKYIADPTRDAVEPLITQLAQLCVKKKKPDEPAPAAATETDPGDELDRLLASPANEESATAKARILYAKAELARLRKQPAEEEKNIAEIAGDFKPEDLSPLLLGAAGDYLLEKGKFDQAAAFYQRLMDEFPKSQMVDFAYNGLGEIAYQKKDYPKALRYFTDGSEKIAAAQKLKDISVGRAKTLLALGKLDEAQKGFEQVASVREWRGEATAFSVYSLGQIAAKRGKWAEANAYFQRVYVGYQKFLPWVAKAYIASGESFEKLGKTQEATNTYRELLRNQKLANFDEALEARKRLEALGQGS